MTSSVIDMQTEEVRRTPSSALPRELNATSVGCSDGSISSSDALLASPSISESNRWSKHR
jgi:hypothetical protein